MNKKLFLFFLSFFCLSIASGARVTDVLNAANIGNTGTIYTEYIYKGPSGAEYNLFCAGDKNSIQLRTKNSDSGIIVKKSPGKIVSIAIDWNSETVDSRILNVYKSSSPFSSTEDLFDSGLSTVTTFKKSDGNKTYTFSPQPEYIGLRSSSAAMYINSITIVWETAGTGEVKPTGVTLNKTNIELKPGQEEQLTASVNPSNTTNKTITWSSSNTSVAKVSSSGKVTGVQSGYAIITAKCGSVSATCEVTVFNPEYIPDGLYYITNMANNDLAMTTDEIPEHMSNVRLEKLDYRGGQKWFVENSGEGWVRLYPSNDFSFSLNNESNRLENGNNITVLEIISQDKQKWYLDKISDGIFVLRNKRDKNYVIGVENTQLSNNANVQLQEYTGAYNQRWKIVNIGDPALVKNIILNKQSLDLIVNHSEQLIATITPSNIDASNIMWESSNPNIATVDGKGLVSAIKVGQTRITAKCGSVSASCIITVTGAGTVVEATKVTLNKTDLSLYKGSSEQLSATITPSNTTDKTITWQSSNSKVATVSNSGYVQAFEEGTTIITAKCGSASASCTVNVSKGNVEVTGISLNYSNLVLTKGSIIQLLATINPSTANDAVVTWSSSDNSVATVSNTGIVASINEGIATITASCGNYNAKCIVTVTNNSNGIIPPRDPEDFKTSDLNGIWHLNFGIESVTPNKFSQVDADFQLTLQSNNVFLLKDPKNKFQTIEGVYDEKNKIFKVDKKEPLIPEIGNTYEVGKLIGKLDPVKMKITFEGTIKWLSYPRSGVIEKKAHYIFVDAEKNPENAFKYQGIRYIVIDWNAKTCRVSNCVNSKSKCTIPAVVLNANQPFTVVEIAPEAFSRVSGMQEIKIAETVNTIGHNAFANCKNLKKVTLPSSLQVIGNETFYGCSSLQTINLPKCVETIGDFAFADCSVLQNIQLPICLKSIGNSAFSGCSKLQTISLPYGLESIGAYSFASCTNLTDIEIQDNITIIGMGAFCNSGIKSVKLPTNLLSISNSLFADCKNLKEIVIPDHIRKIGSNAFNGCTSLSTVTIPNSVVDIGTDAFYKCPVASLNIDTSIINGWFKGLSSLTNLQIGKNVTEIGDYAFADCKNLTQIVLPPSLFKIGSNAFLNCKEITRINIPAAVKSIGSGAFSGCYNLKTVDIINIGDWLKIKLEDKEANPLGYNAVLLVNGEPLKKLEIPQDDVEIQPYLFYGCNSLEKLVIPNTLKAIYPYTFINCSSLKDIYIFANSRDEIPFAFADKEYGPFFYDSDLSGLSPGVNKIPNIKVHIPAGMANQYLSKASNALQFFGQWTKLNLIEDLNVSDHINATSIQLDKTNISLKTGDITSMETTVYPPNATASIFWESEDPTVVTVSEGGLLSAIKEGKTRINARIGDVTAFCIVTVEKAKENNPPINLSLNYSELTLNVGDPEQLIPKIEPKEIQNGNITWTSSNNSVVDVSKTGLVKALAPGTVTITAKYGNVSASCNVKVEEKPVPIYGLLLDRYEIYLELRQKDKISATMNPPQAATEPVKWSSGDIGIVYIYENGEIVGNSVGTTTITATCGDFSASCIVTVYNPDDLDFEYEGIFYSLLDMNAESCRTRESYQLFEDFGYEPGNKLEGFVMLPDVVFRGSKSYPIVEIGAGGFEENYNLKSISIPSSVSKIGISAFDYCYSLKEIYCFAVTPPECADDASFYQVPDMCVLYVPEGTKDLYASAEGWRQFKNNIIENITDGVVKPQSISISQTSVTLNIGRTVQLNSTVSPDYLKDVTATWTSSNNNIATVSNDGLVTAVGDGTAEITAEFGGKKAICKVTSKTVEADGLYFNNYFLNLDVGETFQMITRLYPSDTTDPTIKWSTSDPSIAVVSDKGLISALSSGKAEITATCGNVSARCVVTVMGVEPTSISLNVHSLFLKEGQSARIEATVNPSDATVKDLKWTSSAPSIATVSNSGVVNAKSGGYVIITVQCGSVSSTCEVWVSMQTIEVEKVSLNKTNVMLMVGNTEQLKATISPSDATDKTVNWSSSNSSIASVNSSGLLTAKSAGTAIITAKCGSVSANCSVTVIEDSGVEQIPEDERTNISIFTINGVLLYQNVHAEKIKELAKGIYLIVTETGNTYKIVI